MRVLAVSALGLVLAACADNTPAPEAATQPAAAAPEAAEIVDANALTLDQISQRLVGTFRSADDPLSVLTITADGAFTNIYDGEPDVASAWKVFTGDRPPAGAAGPFTPGSRYLEVSNDGGLFYYELGVVADGGFDMFYTARGNRLAYVRVS